MQIDFMVIVAVVGLLLTAFGIGMQFVMWIHDKNDKGDGGFA